MAVRRDAPRGLPVLVKLPFGPADPVEMARAVVDAGLTASWLEAARWGWTWTPRHCARACRASPVACPAQRCCLALHAVYTVADAMPGVPIVGVGGISTGVQALCFLAAGATAVQLGTVVLHDPASPARVVAELRSALACHDMPTAAAAVGVAHVRKN